MKWKTIISAFPGLAFALLLSFRCNHASAREEGLDARAHWAFQSLTNVTIPHVNVSSALNPIDCFLLQKLQAHGLSFSPPATRTEWARRTSLDLIGLPPAEAEREAFEQDTSPDAREHWIDRLLASPQYGERWGRHWLDLARYAETDGFEHDAVRPESWRYRDYVIQAFNEDKPFNQFIREQIAGDEIAPDRPAAVTATAFLLLGPDMVDSSDPIQRRLNTLNDMTDTVALTFLGLTLGCAKCHDHKFEPLSQRDYYSFQAFFNSARFEREHPIPTPAESARYARQWEEYNAQPALRQLAAFDAPIRAKIFERKLTALSPEAQEAHRTPEANRSAEQANLVLETLAKVAVTEPEIVSELNAADQERRGALAKEVKRVPKPPPLPRSMAVLDGPPKKTFVLRRGDYHQPLAEVAPAIPAVLGGSTEAHTFESRRDLANWLASPENPLTARVMVNRIWQHHFGRPLAGTPSDFGLKGERPTHPELLDWLADEFIAGGWSVKRMHKLMLLSAAYGQAATSNGPALATTVDPENGLYWRMNRLRVEGEVVRDSLLAVCGRLNEQMGGPSVLPPIPRELFAGATGWTPSKAPAEMNRRSVYIFARRNLRFPFLEVFDAPDSNLSCPARERSTTAPQSLTLLNSDEVMAAANDTARRIEERFSAPADQLQLAYQMILGRSPSAAEQETSLRFLAESPVSELCRALFNVNDFVYTP